MAFTLSYGFIQPENGDKGSTWFPALNDNISQLNDHVHDGVTSALIPSTSIINGAVAILPAAWVLDVTGRYKQDVTVPAGYNMSDFSITFYLSTGEILVPSITKLSSTTFRIFTCDNTLSFVAVFR